MAICAGVLDWRYRRIPNWLTVSGFAAGIAINTILFRWAGVKDAVLGAVLGLGILLPFVLVRSLGAGDWKLAGALGACLGWRQMLSVLMGTILVAGVMALAVVDLERATEADTVQYRAFAGRVVHTAEARGGDVNR